MTADAASRPRIGLGLGYAAVSAAIAILAAYPVYGSRQYIAVAVSATVLGLLVAGASRLWRWQWWMTTLAGFGVFVALGLGVAIPGPWTSAGAVAAMFRDLAAGATTAFKDLLTVDLPVDGYRNLLVPALVVLLAGSVATALASWRTDRWGALAAMPALAMPMFGLLFGRTATSDPLQLGPVAIPAPAELALGAAALVSTVAWLSWRAQIDRREALRRAAVSSGIRVSRRRRPASEVRRMALACGMLAVAVAAGALAAPAVAEGRSRDVLRSGTGPEVALTRAISPLSEYRTHFATAAAVEGVLFRVEPVSGALPDRIRLAVLSSYDGTTYRVTSGDGANRFTRVPLGLDPGPGAVSTVRIEIDGLDGIWLPTFGSLGRLSFSGADAATLADGFYYSDALDAGVETGRGGLRAGDEYTLRATEAQTSRLADQEAPGVAPGVQVPDSLTAWIDAQGAGTDGAALVELIDRLRSRGYLSHALDGADAAWTAALGPGYVVQPSPAGHSLARVDEMFTDLLRREAAAAEEGGSASLVAAVGDDEQFAVAAALIAEQLGFPARVVVGTRLSGADPGVPPCVDGVCTGGNMAAWLEVATRDGQWVPVDVTPQHEAGRESEETRQRDPEVPTQVRPDAAREVVPPDPVQDDADDSTPPVEESADLRALWSILRVSAIMLLALIALVGPFIVILIAKRLRRRSRRAAHNPAARIVGGWDEYVDAAVDSGLRMPRVDTRTELAAAYATPSGQALAVAADRAVFSDGDVTAADSEAFWRIVDEERKRFAATAPLWRRAVAAVSLTSFTRGLAPRAHRGRAAPRRTGRRGRRFGDAR